MPYIKQEDRGQYDDLIQDMICMDGSVLPSCGDLNYIITQLCHQYVKHNGLKYQTLNDVVGVLNAANMEFYRRVVAPYEDKKIDENGDIEVAVR